MIELEEIVDVEHVPALIRALDDSDEFVRRLAISLLEELGDARALPGIIEHLSDPDAEGSVVDSSAVERRARENRVVAGGL